MIKVKNHILILLGITGSVSFGQDTSITYYDKDWYTCSENGAVYFGKRYVDAAKIVHADDYYISGKIQMTGTYLSK